MNRASFLNATWMIRVVVWVFTAKIELQSDFFGHEADHLSRIPQESIDSLSLKVIACFMGDVTPRRIDVVSDARLFGERIARHPKPTTGPRRGAEIGSASVRERGRQYG